MPIEEKETNQPNQNPQPPPPQTNRGYSSMVSANFEMVP